MTLHTQDCQRPLECCCCFHCSTEYWRCSKSKEPENQVEWLRIEKEEFVNTCTDIWVIPCEINTKNGHMSQISLKLCAHIVYQQNHHVLKIFHRTLVYKVGCNS